jgi:hypothetical protein
MKKHLLTLISIFLFTATYAQKFELSVDAISGLYHFSGKSAQATSFINGAGDKDAYTNNPYGSKNGFSYGAALRALHVSKGGFIWGMSAGYDLLRAKTSITQVYPDEIFPDMNVQPTFPAKGTTYLQTGYVNLSPFVGYRLKANKVRIDFLPGFDLAFSTSSYNKGTATTTETAANIPAGTTYKIDRNEYNTVPDFRLKFGVAATYNRFGLNASVAHGLVNFESHTLSDGGNYDVKSELLRFGLTYQIR